MKVIIADDHPVVRQGLRQMLATESDLTVVGEARNGQEVVDLSRRVPWEVAVLDYNMPGKNGLELIKELRQRYPGRAVLILSMYPEDRYAVRAWKAGASGYLTKESAPDELVNAIRKVAGGGRYVTPSLGEKLALELEDNRGKPLHETLSDREYQVMWMIASGKTVRQIADELFLSPNTVSTHRTRILRKMNMKSNAELMHYAIAHAFNDVVEMEEAKAAEIARIADQVGKEGQIAQRVTLPGATGAWADTIESVNTLIGDMVYPVTEVARVIGSVAKGDLSQTMV